MTDRVVDILLIEDNKLDADLTIRALKMKNITANIEWLKDGVEALDYLFVRGRFDNRPKNCNPRVILLDLKMPKINGLEVLKQLRKHAKTKNIPVVVLTSSQEEKDIIKSYENGVNSYIVKPVNFRQLMDAVSIVGLYWLTLNKSATQVKF